MDEKSAYLLTKSNLSYAGGGGGGVELGGEDTSGAGPGRGGAGRGEEIIGWAEKKRTFRRYFIFIYIIIIYLIYCCASWSVGAGAVGKLHARVGQMFVLAFVATRWAGFWRDLVFWWHEFHHPWPRKERKVHSMAESRFIFFFHFHASLFDWCPSRWAQQNSDLIDSYFIEVVDPSGLRDLKEKTNAVMD